MWQLIVFGLVTIPCGLACWNGLGKHFGLGKTAMRIDRTSATIMIALLVVLASAMSAWGQPPVDAEGKAFGSREKRVSLAYLPGESNVSPKDVPWRLLTHIGHAFLQADEHGNVTPGHGVPNQDLTKVAHNQDVRVLISLGGGDSVTAFEKITADSERLARYVAGVVKLVDDNGYDGVDVDWEFPRSASGKKGFSALAAALRIALDEAARKHDDGRRYELTAAISSGEHFGRWLDDKTLREAFDFLNVMTYDMAGPWSTVVGHHAPLFPSRDDPQRSVRSVEFSMTYWNRRRRIPKEKLCVGIPLYGRLFPVGRPHVKLDPADKEKHKTIAFSQLRNLSREGWMAKWDHDAKVPWLFAPNRQAIVAFDDRNSVHQKAEWARKQGFRGMFYWALPQDRMEDGKNWLIEAAVRAWPE